MTIRATSARRQAVAGVFALPESLESRLHFCATHAAAAMVRDFFTEPADDSGVQSQPPGPYTGPTPAGVPTAYTTLANGMPVLNSRPAAPTAIFLDFDGSSVAADPVTPYDVDGNASTFNVAEQQTIHEAWREISAYFAIFDINVTTIQPAAAMPKAWLAVGNNISGGYSYVNVFPNSEPESWNNSGDARTRVSGLAHELGHNFGLSHQATWDQWGVKTAEYASATDALHGSIMGVDFSGTVHKFIWGHNSGGSGASTLQDDITVIANKIKPYQPAGGDGMRVDDFGNSIAAATALPVVDGAQWTTGVIERLADADAFSFNSVGGTYALSASPDMPSGVDLKLSVFNAAGTLLAESDSANNVQQLTMSLGAGTYYAIVSSHQNYGDVGQYFMSVSQLPTGWSSGEIGTGTAGYTIHDATAGQFSLVATGVGNSGTSGDMMQYARQTLTGNGTIIARVTNVDGTNASAFAGVSIRESAATNSRQVSIYRTFSNGPRFQYRSSAGGATSTVNGTAGAFAPTWLRLVRSGNTFVGSTSTDGVSWTQLGSVDVAMGSTVTIGLIAGSNNNHAMNVGQLDNVTVTGTLGTTPPVYNSLAAPANPAVALASGSGLTFTWNSVAGATGYVVERSSDGVTYAQVGTPTATTYTDASLTGSMRYFYRVSASDASGRSTPSAVASAVNRPSAISSFSVTKLNTTTLVLNWRETTGETGYRIERSTDGVTFTAIATVAANQPSYTNTGLTSGVNYTYRVTPTSALGDGVASGTVVGAPRLAAVTPTLVASAGSMALTWTDIADETGYRVERSTDGTTFSSLTTLAAGTTSYTDTTVTAATEYYYRVYGTTATTQSLTGTVRFAAAPSATPPAAPWASQDIGTVAGTGTTNLASGSYKIISSGTTIGGTSDSFRFTSRSLVDSGEIVARIDALEDTGTSAKAGVMIRASTAANSANVFAYVTPTAIGFSSRSTTGGSTTTATTVTGTAPRWLRITRAGNVFTGQYSSDGVTWTTISTATITMNASVLAGLAATAGSTAALNTATASNVNVVSADVLAVTSINRASATPTNASSLQFNVTFSQNVTGVDTGDFALALTGTTATIDSVTGSGASYVVTVTGVTGSGTVGLNLVDNDTIVDSVGDKLGGAGTGNGNFTGQAYTVDRTAPTVTLNQATTQADPASGTTINFTAVFSEAISDFTPSDVQLSGTAGATTVVISPSQGGTGGGGNTYNIAVSGMTGPGTVIATLPAGAVRDAVGNLSAASTSTDNSVTFDNVAPAIVKWESAGLHARGVGEAALTIPDDGTFSEPRVSGINTLLVTFDSPINPASLTPAGVGFWGNNATSASINLSGITVTTSTRAGDTVAVLTFSQKLPDYARYLVRLTGVRDVAGNALAGDNDRILTALLGDATGDRRVNSTDVGGVISLRGIDPINAANVFEVRSDVTNDGRINNTDVGGVLGVRGSDARFIADPVAAGGGAGGGLASTASQPVSRDARSQASRLRSTATMVAGRTSDPVVLRNVTPFLADSTRYDDVSLAAAIVNLL